MILDQFGRVIGAKEGPLWSPLLREELRKLQGPSRFEMLFSVIYGPDGKLAPGPLGEAKTIVFTKYETLEDPKGVDDERA